MARPMQKTTKKNLTKEEKAHREKIIRIAEDISGDVIPLDLNESQQFYYDMIVPQLQDLQVIGSIDSPFIRSLCVNFDMIRRIEKKLNRSIDPELIKIRKDLLKENLQIFGSLGINAKARLSIGASIQNHQGRINDKKIMNMSKEELYNYV